MRPTDSARRDSAAFFPARSCSAAVFLCLFFFPIHAHAQDHTVCFTTSGRGTAKPITWWGVDTAWPSPDNMRQALVHMGADQIDMVRMCFFVDEPLTGKGELGDKTRKRLDQMIEIAKMAGNKPWTLLPATESGVHPSFKNGAEVRVDRWVRMLEATQQYIGRPIRLVEPFNEPDWGWGQGTRRDLHDILKSLRDSRHFEGTRLAGPSVLDCNQARHWYDGIKDHVTIGTTHCLNGGLRSYTDFIRHVRSNRHAALNPEAHNLVEVITGAEHGLWGAIWWGPPVLPRGLFVKACQGRRLAYVEDADRWSAAAVYRAPDGVIRGFLGSSERHGQTTTYRFVCGERAVWFNGEGPTHEFTMTVDRHGEEFFEVRWGEDVPPALDGRRFIIVNRQSGKALTLAKASGENGVNIEQRELSGGETQQWDVKRERLGYFAIQSFLTRRTAEVADWSLDNGATVRQWGTGDNALQHWFVEYVGDGYFHIRNQHTGKYMQVAPGNRENGADVVQWEGTGGKNQQWRFFPARHPVDYVAPAVPEGLTAEARDVSAKLDWQEGRDGDLSAYTVFRSATRGGPYGVLASTRENTYIDSSATRDRPHYYVVRATDHALNHSALSLEAVATPTGKPVLAAYLPFDGHLRDVSGNGNDATATGTPGFQAGRDKKAVVLDGRDDFLALPPGSVGYPDITIAAWVYWGGGADWQRILDFGNDRGHNMYLTPRSGDGTLRFVIQNGGGGRQLNTEALPARKWIHVAVVLEGDEGRLYVNGVCKDKQVIKTDPSDFDPVTLWIGKSHWPDPLFKGMIDEFRIYNHALPGDQIEGLVVR